MEIKKSELLANIFIFLTVLYSFLNILIYGTTLNEYENLYSVLNNMITLTWEIIRIFILIKLLIQFDKRTMFAFALITIAILTSYFSKGGWVSECIWLICGMKKVNIKKFVKYLFFSNLIGTLTIIILSYSGVINDLILYRGAMARHSMGFNHPNAFGARILQLASMYLFLKKDTIKKKDCILTLVLAMIILSVADSLTSFFLMIILSFGVFFISILNKRNIKLKKIFERIFLKFGKVFWIIPIIAVSVTVLSLNVSKYFGGNLLSRILQARYYFDYYGLSFFGTQLETNNTIENFNLQFSKLYTLDNGYIYLLLGYGVISFSLFVVGNVFLSKKLFAKKDYVSALVIVIYSIYGLFETMMIRYTYNFSLLLLAELLWNNSE